MTKTSPSQYDTENSQRRLGVTFHRTFSMKRSAIKQVLELSINTTGSDGESDGFERKLIRELTELGTVYVQAIPRYCYGVGLLDLKYTPTLFGQFAYKHDPSLENLNTQWLMHYFLSAPHGPGPIFWHEIVYNRFRSGNEFTQKDIESDISEIYKREMDKALNPRSITSTANIFLDSYVKHDGLGNLGILEEVGDNQYRVSQVDTPPLWIVAVAVLDYWQSNFPNQVGINLTSLTTESKLPSLFMISRSRLDLIMGEMREAGIVELFRTAPPYQVALLNGDLEPIFQRIYSYG